MFSTLVIMKVNSAISRHLYQTECESEFRQYIIDDCHYFCFNLFMHDTTATTHPSPLPITTLNLISDRYENGLRGLKNSRETSSLIFKVRILYHCLK